MKKVITRVLLCAMVLSSLVVLPIYALETGEGDIYITDEWVHLTVYGGGGSGSNPTVENSELCRKTLDGDAYIRNATITRDSNALQGMTGYISFYCNTYGSSREVAGRINISANNSAPDKSYTSYNKYTNEDNKLVSYGQIDKLFFIKLNSTSASNLYWMRLDAIFQP